MSTLEEGSVNVSLKFPLIEQGLEFFTFSENFAENIRKFQKVDQFSQIQANMHKIFDDFDKFPAKKIEKAKTFIYGG